MLTLSRGQRLGPYEIRTVLGSGSMGEVYRARDTRMGRNVAIKVMGPAIVAKGAVALQRFELEARAAGSLNQENLLTIHDFGEEKGSRYMVCEFLDGETLRDRLDLGPVPARKAVDYTIQICRGLAAAHEKGILHRDLKPDNVFITKDGRIKILDFGLAKLIEPEARSQILGAAGPLTAPGIVMGTARYMSPEQARDLPLDARSDLFSVGSLLYEMLCGKPAFKGLTPLEAMTNIAKHDPADLVYPGEQILGLDLIVHHCLEKQPDARVQSARDLIFQLETVLSGGVAEPPEPPKTPRWVWAALALLIVAAPSAAFLFGRRASAAVMPSFHKLSFRRGSVRSARFAPDGQTVVYSAAWDAEPLQLYSTRPESPESRALGLPDVRILSVSSTGELALLSGKNTLSRVPLAGGAPRELLDGVFDADWAPDGQSLAVVRFAGGKYRLEYPAGKVLYETSGWISRPRVSAAGDVVAFIDHEVRGYTRGAVSLVDRNGVKRALSKTWLNARGVAWSPAHDEVWFTAGQVSGETAVRAVDLKGRERLVVPSTGNLTLQDVAPDGHILLSQASLRNVMMVAARDRPPRDLSWMDLSIFADLSDDGGTLLFLEVGVAQAAQNSPAAIYLRKTDGSPAVRLGEGSVSRLSPDGKFVLASPGVDFSRELQLLPTGSGEVQKINLGDVALTGDPLFFPDGKRLLLRGRQRTQRDRLFVLEPGGAPRPITAEGIGDNYLVAHDGARVVVSDGQGGFLLQDLAGGEPAKVAGAQKGDLLAGWSADGGTLWFAAQQPPQLFAVSLATGRREPWKPLFQPDRAGAGNLSAVHVTPDGAAYAWDYDIHLDELYLADGVR